MRYDAGPEAAQPSGEVLETGEPVLPLPRIRSLELEAAAAGLASVLFPGQDQKNGYLIDADGHQHIWTRAFAAHALHVLPPRLLQALSNEIGNGEHQFLRSECIRYIRTLYEAQAEPQRAFERCTVQIGNALVFGPLLEAYGAGERWPLEPQDYDERLNWALRCYEMGGAILGFASHYRHSTNDYFALPRKERDRARAYVLVALITLVLAGRDTSKITLDLPRLTALVRRNLQRSDLIVRTVRERRSADPAVLADVLRTSAPALGEGAL